MTTCYGYKESSIQNFFWVIMTSYWRHNEILFLSNIKVSRVWYQMTPYAMGIMNLAFKTYFWVIMTSYWHHNEKIRVFLNIIKPNSVVRRTLWDLLRRRGIPTGILSLISALYSDTESAIKSGGDVSRFFQVKSGVRQGYVFAPSLFNTWIDWVILRREHRSPTTSC